MRKIVTKGLHPMTGNWAILSLEDIDKTDGTSLSEEDITVHINRMKSLIEDIMLVSPEKGSYVTLHNDERMVTFDPRKFLAVEVYVEKYFTVETIQR